MTEKPTFNFNLSYSAYSMFKKSPLQFYYVYLTKTEPSDSNETDYGNAGSVVHEALEHYISTGEIDFDVWWNDKKGDNFTGFGNRPLKKDLYYSLFLQGINNIDNMLKEFPKESIISELKVEKEFFGVNIKAFIDIYIDHNGIILKDWKTNSKSDYEMHKDQRLFYSWLIYKTKGIIPKCEWIYFKTGKTEKDEFSKEELLEFEIEIVKFLNFIEKNQHDIKAFEGGQWNHPFNNHFTLCRKEMERRREENEVHIHLSIKGNYVFFEGDIDPILEDGIDYATQFDLKDKHFMQQAVKEKARGNIDLQDIGTVHLYNRRFKCFPIGLMEKVKKICNEFGEYYEKKVKLFIDDKRDKVYFYWTVECMPDSLLTDMKFRPYQTEAIEKFMEKKSGVINIATGGGKTFVAAEIIRRARCKTLWIIDQKELLDQTKRTLESLLGFEIGLIASGTVDIRDVTIATIQSLNSKLKELSSELYKFNMVVVDEFHKSAAESYQKVFAKLPNTQYRLGLTATASRDDGKDPILFSILSDVVYKISSEDLIEMGYLVKPKIQFYKIKGFDLFKCEYQDDYVRNVVEHEERNSKIQQIVQENQGKKILILTKRVDHGKYLNEKIIGSQHIHGCLGKNTRTTIMDDFRNSDSGVLIMTHSIGAEGLDIPDLDIMINAAANKGDVKSIQILGRVLRIFNNKSEALYIDFLDVGYHTQKHSEKRMKIFKSQGHTIEVVS